MSVVREAEVYPPTVFAEFAVLSKESQNTRKLCVVGEYTVMKCPSALYSTAEQSSRTRMHSFRTLLALTLPSERANAVTLLRLDFVSLTTNGAPDSLTKDSVGAASFASPPISLDWFGSVSTRVRKQPAQQSVMTGLALSVGLNQTPHAGSGVAVSDTMIGPRFVVTAKICPRT